MLPPELAGLCFVDTSSGSDAALAERAAAAVPGGRWMLLGASRPGLIRALAAAGLDVVVVDSSRTALRRTRAALGDDSGALLLAADPRELEIPGGVDAMLVPSAVWHAVLLSPDRRHVLRGMSKELRAGGLLLLELERLPEPPASEEPVPSGFGGVLWRRSASEGFVEVRSGDVSVTFAMFSPEEAIAEARDEGFEHVSPTAAGASVVWASLRTTEGRA